MSTRIDHRNKTQPSNHQQQPQQGAGITSGTAHREEYDYNNHLQMHSQPSVTQQVPYNPPMISNQTSESNYVNGYYPPNMNSVSYPANFFDASTWTAASNSEAMSYFGNYTPEYMQFASGFDYAPAVGFSWPSYGTNDYSSWNTPQQVDPMKVDSQQVNMVGQSYPDYYPSPTAASTSQRTTTGSTVNGSVDNNLSSSISVEPIDTSELELGMNAVTINGNGTAIDHGQHSPSDSSIQEPAPANLNNSSSKTSSSTPSSSVPPKPMSWANVASQPAKPAPPKPVQPVTKTQTRSANPSNHDTFGGENGQTRNQNVSHQPRNAWSAPRSSRSTNGTGTSSSAGHRQQSSSQSTNAGGSSSVDSDPTLSKLKQTNSYNPKSFDLNAKNARFFVIKSYSEDDIHRAIKYGVWCSTEHGNKRLDAAFKEREGKGPIYLFYSVNGSGHFCGMAQMMSGVDYQTHAGVWTQDKWKGSMEIKWVYVKDVPNNQLRHIRLENNENKPVTNSRDTQEVPADKGKQVLKIMHTYRHSTSIFDDFGHYEKKEVEEGGEGSSKKKIMNGTKN